MAVKVNALAVKKCLDIAVRAALVVMIGGSPGIGKSSVVHEVADDYNLALIDVRLAQCDPTDLNGFPFVLECKTKAGYVPMETFPLEGDPLPEGKQGWMIFFDELNSAPRGVQAASYKIVLDRMIGQRQLHPNVVMVAAGNLDTDNAIVEELSSALQSRMIHLEMASDADVWLDIAARHQIDPRITSFIRFKPKNVNTFNPSTQNAEKTYACERTWFFANKLFEAGLDIDDRETALPLLAGTISEGVAREFIGHVKVYHSLPEVPEIVRAPQTTMVPTKPDQLYAICGAIAHHAKEANIDPLMEYLERTPKEYQVVALREMARRNVDMLRSPSVAQWSLDNGEELF